MHGSLLLAARQQQHAAMSSLWLPPLAGHDHIYERTCPVYKQTCVNYNSDGSARGPVHVVIGNSG